MATTALMPVDPALSADQMNRIPSISANLLPDEVVAARRARNARLGVLAGLILVVLLLATWYVYALNQVRVATNDLNAVTTQAADLERSQTRYAGVVNIENQTQTISKQLGTLLANDMSWSALLTTLRTTGTAASVTVTGVNGNLNKPTGGTPDLGTLPTAKGVTVIGTLIVTGSAPDKPSIAKYVDALGKIDTIANPYLTNAAVNNGALSFSITIDVTAQARCGRFTRACANPGGK